METYAAVSVNGELKAARTNAARHAESMLINSGDWEPAVVEAEQTAPAHGGRSDLVLIINRSPCKASCTGVLSNWLQANKSRYPHVRFILAPTAAYAPTITRGDMIEMIANYLDETGQQLQGGVPFKDFIKSFTTEEIRASFERRFGRLVQTMGVREDEASDENDFRRLANAGWNLRQLQARPKPTPAELRLAEMVTQVRQELGQTFDQQEKVG